jgi:signal transduction histidine kinase
MDGRPGGALAAGDHRRLTREVAHAAVVDERLRISRELHDVIGHSMSLIAVKATVANHVADARPEEARAALTAIEQTSRTTLTEIRRVLGMLRANGDPHEALIPSRGLSGLTELADRARSAGVDVELTVCDDDALPEAVGMSVYRIVQEALTNVVAHAAPTRCRVTVETNGGDVTIDVTDAGPRSRGQRPAATGGGYGLIGIRERVMMYGGAFTAGPPRWRIPRVRPPAVRRARGPDVNPDGAPDKHDAPGTARSAAEWCAAIF